jgi:hypothetical protein
LARHVENPIIQKAAVRYDYNLICVAGTKELPGFVWPKLTTLIIFFLKWQATPGWLYG